MTEYAEKLRAWRARSLEIVRRRDAGETFRAIGRDLGICAQRVWTLDAKARRISGEANGVQPRVYVQQKRYRCSYCTGPMGSPLGYETACGLCMEHGVLGRVLWKREAPWDFHAPRRKAARERSAD